MGKKMEFTSPLHKKLCHSHFDRRDDDVDDARPLCRGDLGRILPSEVQLVFPTYSALMFLVQHV